MGHRRESQPGFGHRTETRLVSAAVYERRLPSPDLADLVEGIWIQENAADSSASEAGCVLPTGTVEIIFNYRDPIVHVEGGSIERMPQAYITGQRTRPVYPACEGEFGVVAVSLYPWAVEQAFPECVHETDGFTDLQLLSDWQRIEETLERLRAADSVEQRCAVVEAYLRARRADRRSDPLIRDAVLRLSDCAGEAWVLQIARDYSLSRRQFTRRFTAAVGIPPKRFSRIMRFQQALGLRRHSEQGWAAIAQHCGYSDQAHLSHEIRELSGRTPTEIARPRSVNDEIFNGGRVSRFFDTVYL